MSADKNSLLDTGPLRDRLERYARRADDLPAEARQLVDEILESLATTIEELQVTAEELSQQNIELQLAQDYAQGQRRRYRDMFEFAPDGYLLTDGVGVIQEANQVAAELLAIPAVQLVDKPLVLYIAPGDRDRFHAYLDRIAEWHPRRISPGAEIELSVQPGEGNPFPAALTVAPVRDEHDQLTGLRWILRDISASKRAEERERLLATTEEQRRLAEEGNKLLEALIETMPVGAVIADAEGNILSLNAAAHEILGSGLRGNLAQPKREHTTHYPGGEPMPNEEMPLIRTLEEGRNIRDIEMLIRRADGEERFISASAAPVRNSDGEIISGIAIFEDITERKRIMAALHDERARFKGVFENAPEAILVADADGRIILANPAAEELYRRPVPYDESFEPSERVEALHSDGSPFTPEEYPILRSALYGEHLVGVEMFVRWQDGEQRDLLISSAPLENVDGGLLGAVALVQDVSPLKQAQRSLERYSNYLKVLHRADVAILAAESAEQLVDEVLPLVLEMAPATRVSVLAFDREAGEAAVLGILGEGDSCLPRGMTIPIGDDWHLDKLKEEPFRIFEALSNVPISAELRATLRQDGDQAYFAIPLVAQDQLLGALNLALEAPGDLGLQRREILRQLADQLAIGLWQARLQEELHQYTEKLEEMVAWRTASLRASEARFRAIFSQTAVGIAVLDGEGRILNCNPALEQILGVPRDDLKGHILTEFASPEEDIDTDVQVYGQLLADEREHYHFKTRFQGADGQTGWANVILSSIDDENEDSNLVAAMIEDITEQTRAQQALIQSEKLAVMGRVSASLAHEINNPLQSVIGCLGLADEMLTEEDDVRRFVRIAIEELESAAEIVAQLRDLSREPETLEMEPVDLKELVDRTLFLTGKRLREKEIKTTWESEGDLPRVSGAPDRLRQVFLNLVLNAAEAMPDGGRLRISAAPTEEPEGVRLRFSDSGVGIEAENIKRLFEPFYSTRTGGMGMGLYVCQKIIQAHGGHIEVDSRPGEGATFTIWLPAGEEKESGVA